MEKGRWDSSGRKDKERRPFPQDRTCPALPRATTPIIFWGMFPKRVTSALVWGSLSPLLQTHSRPEKACPHLSVFRHTQPSDTFGPPQPPPQPLLPDPFLTHCSELSAFAFTLSSHLNLSSVCTSLPRIPSCRYFSWLLHSLDFQVQPTSERALSSGSVHGCHSLG